MRRAIEAKHADSLEDLKRDHRSEKDRAEREFREEMGVRFDEVQALMKDYQSRVIQGQFSGALFRVRVRNSGFDPAFCVLITHFF